MCEGCNDSIKNGGIPLNAWSRKLDATPPSKLVHTFSRPPILEALPLLPVAYRVGNYISHERNHNRQPIFDLSGLTLEPPNPGPHGGVPCGGMGCGAIGRGFCGDFRRWSLHPGRYIHRVVDADQFLLRVKSGGRVEATVLSVVCPHGGLSHDWNWNMDAKCATYHAVFPRAWTVYEEPLPGVRVTINQISPFIPHNYTESSLPACAFDVLIENISDTEDIEEVSVMFTFQNGDGGDGDAAGGFLHSPFAIPAGDGTSSAMVGCLMENHRSPHSTEVDIEVGSMAIAVNHPNYYENTTNEQNNEDQSRPTISFCKGFTTESPVEQAPARIANFIRTSFFAQTMPVSTQPQSQPQTSQDVVDDRHISAVAETITTPKRMGPSIAETSPLLKSSRRFEAQSLREEPVISAKQLWESFHDTGNASHLFTPENTLSYSRSAKGYKIGSALCVKYSNIAPKSSRQHSFSLAWDNPIVHFGETPKSSSRTTANDDPKRSNGSSNNNSNISNSSKSDNSYNKSGNNGGNGVDSESGLPRFYTKFFGASGDRASVIAAYALLHRQVWIADINRWQRETPFNPAAPDFYRYQLFNELYFLVDGGTVWTNSSNGRRNKSAVPMLEEVMTEATNPRRASTPPSTNTAKTKAKAGDDSPIGKSSFRSNSAGSLTSRINQDLRIREQRIAKVTQSQAERSAGSSRAACCASSACCCLLMYSQQPTRLKTVSHQGDRDGDNPQPGSQSDAVRTSSDRRLNLSHLAALRCAMLSYNSLVCNSEGSQDIAGQFLYLEGHEYYMYNTYDVHFYSSFALLMLFPALELSLQRDFALAIPLEDKTERVMMGEGYQRPRKVKNVVPHDLGSPSGHPWQETNAYNFQDVSNWKDLGPKFILQTYRDIVYMSQRGNAKSKGGFLRAVYPCCLIVMKHTEEFDLDGDGMIENSGFPDQTYDIWTAKGVHAYCGGLWIAACFAMKEMALLMDSEQAGVAKYYGDLAERAKEVYNQKLWNGYYYNYSSERADDHHTSIMADMLAGQWYAHACQLPDRVVDRERALTCLNVIHHFNVRQFGGGLLRGAVNGMKPQKLMRNDPAGSGPGSGSAVSEASVPDLKAAVVVDNTCLQSREVWTGTTYALAAVMLHEAEDMEFGPVAGSNNNCRNMNISNSSNNSNNSNGHRRDISEGNNGKTANVETVETIAKRDESINAADGGNNGTNVDGNGCCSVTGVQPNATIASDAINSNSIIINNNSADTTTSNKTNNNNNNSSSSRSNSDKGKSNLNLNLNTFDASSRSNRSAQSSSGRYEMPAFSPEMVVDLSPQRLRDMAFSTAQGIHDGAWQSFGYWFATPEGIESSGNYRSLGYMRPLSIWALQYASEMRQQSKQSSSN